jgi:hypothetical protein
MPNEKSSLHPFAGKSAKELAASQVIYIRDILLAEIRYATACGASPYDMDPRLINEVGHILQLFCEPLDDLGYRNGLLLVDVLVDGGASENVACRAIRLVVQMIRADPALYGELRALALEARETGNEPPSSAWHRWARGA